MIQITPHMRIFLAVDPADFRKGIDGFARVCKSVLKEDPFSGHVFVFRNRSGKPCFERLFSCKIPVKNLGGKKLKNKLITRHFQV